MSDPVPPDDTPIWRYMEIDKFQKITESGGKLFFARPYKFIDKWDGQYPPAFARNTKDHEALFRDEFAKRKMTYRYASLVSCWNMGNDESDLMWNAYGKAPNGVAIQSTVGSLKRCLHPHNSGACVYYDPVDDIRCENVFGNAPDILFKRRHFVGEAEFRIWFTDDDLLDRIEQGEIIDETKLPSDSINGRNYSIEDMPALVNALVMPPGASDSFVEKVKQVCRTFGKSWLVAKIKASSLDRSFDSYL